MLHHKKIGTFLLTMLMISAVFSIDQILIFVGSGVNAFLYFSIACLVFFIPIVLISAELASGWAGGSGIFGWVKAALGPYMGFLAVWLLWARSIALYTGLFGLIIGVVDLVWSVDIVGNPLYTFLLVFALFLILTGINLLGVRIAGTFSAINVLVGVIIPFSIIAYLTFRLVKEGNFTLFFSAKGETISFQELQWLSLLAVAMVGFAGIEVSTFFAKDVDHPNRNYPRAMLIALAAIFFLKTLGLISVGSLSKAYDRNLITSFSQQMGLFFCSFNRTNLAPTALTAFSLGALGQVNTWMLGSTRGILTVANSGVLPFTFMQFLTKGKDTKAPLNLLLFQAVTLSLFTSICLSFLDFKNFAISLGVLSAQMCALMYILVFISALVIRYKKPEIRGRFHIPFGNAGLWAVCILGLLSTVFMIGIGCFVPATFSADSPISYYSFIGWGLLFFLGTPLFLILWGHLHKKRI